MHLGIGWKTPTWLGTIVIAVMAGFGVAFLVAPPSYGPRLVEGGEDLPARGARGRLARAREKTYDLTEAAAGGFDCPMRVMVTGGSGLPRVALRQGARRRGPRRAAAVRSPARIAPALAPHGLNHVDHVVGDVTDTASVERALEGCDAVLHAANVYTLDPRRARGDARRQPAGHANVLRAAHERGMDPIVHVSSNAALMPSPDRPLTPESPLGDPPGAYSQSKVEAERIAH